MLPTGLSKTPTQKKEGRREGGRAVGRKDWEKEEESQPTFINGLLARLKISEDLIRESGETNWQGTSKVYPCCAVATLAKS